MDHSHISTNAAVCKNLFDEDERVLFSDKVMKITDNGLPRPRVLTLTNKAVYTLTAGLVLKRRLSYDIIGGLTEDGEGRIVIHVPSEWDERLQLARKAAPQELREVLTSTYQTVVNRPLPIMIKPSAQIFLNIRTKAMAKRGAVNVQKPGSTSTFHDAMRSKQNPQQQGEHKSSECEICKKPFNVFRRSYVCTLCKIYVCSSCSDLDFFPGFEDKVRACTKCLTKKPPTNVVKGVASGVRSIAKGVLEGATGVVLDPLRGAQRDGLSGFVKGVQTGLTGVVVKPARGIVDALESTAKGVINTPLYVASLAAPAHLDVPVGVNQGNALLKLKEVLLRRGIVEKSEELKYHVPNANNLTQVKAFIAGKDEGARDCVIITTKSVLSLVNDEVAAKVPLVDIRSAMHQVLPTSDRLVLKTKTSSTSIEFQEKDACAFFANTLRGLTVKSVGAIPLTIKMDKDKSEGMEMPTEITHSTELVALQAEIEKSKLITLLDGEVLEYHHVNLTLSHPKRATNFVGLTSLLSDCVILTNLRLLALDSGEIVVEIARAEIRSCVGEAVLLQWAWGQLVVTLLSGQVVKVTMNEREVCNFYRTVIGQGVAERLRAVFNQNFRSDSATRSFSFADNSSFYILSKFGGHSLVLDHQCIPGQHDTELILAPISGAITQKWTRVDDENGEPCIVPLACVRQVNDGSPKPVLTPWTLKQVWSEADADKGFVRLKGTDLCLSIEGFCCGNIQCEKSRVRAGVRVCMSPAVSVSCAHDEGRTEASPIQHWSFPTDFEVFIEDLVEPAVDALQEWQQCKNETEEQKSHTIPPLYVGQFKSFWTSWQLSVAEPILPPGGLLFGHYLTPGEHKYQKDVLTGMSAMAAFHQPASFERIGIYNPKANEGTKNPLYFWKPVPHRSNFVALGHICTSSNFPPKPDILACVDKAYLEETTEADLQQFGVIENNEGGLSLWTSGSMATFFACHNPDGVHSPPKGPFYRFPRNEADLKKVQKRLGTEALEMMGELSRYMVEVVTALDLGEAEDSKDPLWLHDCYGQLLELIQNMQDVLQHEGFKHFEMDKERLLTYMDMFNSTQTKLKRYIYLRLKFPFKTLQDCAWELNLASTLVEVLNPVTWPEIVSWDFPVRLSEEDAAKLKAREGFAPAVIPTFLELLCDRAGTRAKELMSMLVDHELGLEGSDPSLEDKELLAALSGHGLSAKFSDEDEPRESKISASSVVDATGKLLDQLVDVVCVVATRTGSKKARLEPVVAQLFWERTYQAMKKLFKERLVVTQLTPTQAIFAIRTLRKLRHLAETNKIANEEASVWVTEQIDVLGRVYVAATRATLVGFISRFNKTEETYPCRLAEGFLSTPGPEDVSETFTRVFDGHQQNKLDANLLAKIAQTQGMALEYFLMLRKFKFRNIVLLQPDTPYNLALAVEVGKGGKSVEAKDVDRFLLHHGGTVSLTWMLAQCNDVSRWCQNIGNLKTTLLNLFSEDPEGIDMFTGLNNSLAAATEGFREFYDCYVEALTAVIVKYTKLACTQIGGAAWIDKSKHSEVIEDMCEHLHSIKDYVVTRIQHEPIQGELFRVLARSVTSRYLANVIAFGLKYPADEVKRFLEPDSQALLKALRPHDAAVEKLIKQELDYINTVHALFEVEVDFLMLHTDTLNKRFQDDLVIANDKIGSSIFGARSDLPKGEKSRAIASFPPLKSKSHTQHGIIGENWRFKVLFERAKVSPPAANDKKASKSPNLYCTMIALGPKSETGAQATLFKAKTPVAKNSLEPVWDFLFQDMSASVLALQDITFEIFETSSLGADKSLGAVRVSVEDIYGAEAESGSYIKLVPLQLAIKDKDDKRGDLTVRLLFSNDPMLKDVSGSQMINPPPAVAVEEQASPPEQQHAPSSPTNSSKPTRSQKVRSTFANLLHKPKQPAARPDS